MDRSSKAITLALIGSAFLLGGCANKEEEDEWGDGQAVAGQGQNSQGRAGHGGVIIIPRVGGYGGGSGAGGGVATSPSARGGFGSTGATGSAGVGS